MSTFPYQRVAVTGGAGFLGQAVVHKLRERGVEPFVPRSSNYNLTNENSIKSLLEFHQPQLVIHLAAVVGGIGANQQNPGRFFYENAVMGIQLMEQCRHYGVEKFVAVGSVCSYPRDTPVPFKEDDLWNGYPEETNAAYGLAKKMMLVQSQAYRQQYGFNSIYLIPVNLFGENDSFDLDSSHVIPALIRKCVEARESGVDHVDVWGSGNASREFLYISDCADAIVKAAELYNDGEPVNVGTGQEVTIKALAEKIAEMAGFKGELRWQTDKPDGQPRRCLDTSRAKERFGFEAKTSLQEGLRKTIEWYERQL